MNFPTYSSSAASGSRARGLSPARLLGSAFFFAGVFFLPWWAMLLLGIALLARFGSYEVVLGGLMADFLYGAPVPLFLEFPFLMTALFALAAAAFFLLRRRLLLP